MSRLVQWLWRACSELGVAVELGFKVQLPDKGMLETVARVPNLGAPNGMLIVRSYDDIKDYVEGLERSGYGFSVLDEPRAAEEFDLESFREMFADWGWTGDLGSKPGWLR